MDSSITAIVEYFVLWAMVHSSLASLTVKGWMRRVFGPGVMRWHRLGFVVFAGLSLLPLLALVVWLPDRRFHAVPSPWWMLMVAGQVCALVALGIAMLQAGFWRFVGLAQIFAGNPTKTGELQVRGFFRYVRHPLYVFGLIAIWLTPVMTANLLLLYVLATLYILVGVAHEERLLVDEYGEAYVNYRRQVPRFLPWPGRVYREGKDDEM